MPGPIVPSPINAACSISRLSRSIEVAALRSRATAQELVAEDLVHRGDRLEDSLIRKRLQRLLPLALGHPAETMRLGVLAREGRGDVGLELPEQDVLLLRVAGRRLGGDLRSLIGVRGH